MGNFQEKTIPLKTSVSSIFWLLFKNRISQRWPHVYNHPLLLHDPRGGRRCTGREGFVVHICGKSGLKGSSALIQAELCFGWWLLFCQHQFPHPSSSKQFVGACTYVLLSVGKGNAISSLKPKNFALSAGWEQWVPAGQKALWKGNE